MLDIQFVRENKDKVIQTAKAKNVKVNVEALLQADEHRRALLAEIEQLRRQRNELSASVNNVQPSADQISKGKALKEQLLVKDKELEPIEKEFQQLLTDIPNVIPDDTPEGGEEANKPEKYWGEPRRDQIKDHQTWGEERGLIDFERGAKVAGNKFYYMKGPLVKLELAVFEMGLDLAEKHGFTAITVPHMVNAQTMSGTGFLPRGEEKQIYKIEDQDLNLIATAEIPIAGYHSDEIIEGKSLPLLYAGLSPAYRQEAGAYGKHSRGLYRVHQFNKLELFVFCKPEESEAWHQKLMAIEEAFCQALEIPYEVVRIAAGDLGAPAYKKYDINYWSPADQNYRELMSCSNVTDYQARRLNIRYRDSGGATQYLHMLNGTAAAFSRICIALVENHQRPDGTVSVPGALRTYFGKETI